MGKASTLAEHSYQFGKWRVEPHLNRVRKASEERLLEPKAMAVLVYLLERPGQVISAAELLDQVWPERIVEENAIQQRISRIRQALDDEPRAPVYIRTISRKGYQAIAPVEPVPDETPAAEPGLRQTLEALTPPFPAYAGSGEYVFVCYAHKDRVAVYPELVRLRDAGIHIWYDEGIAPGSSWTDELAAALTRCRQLLFYVSPNSVTSENCLAEVAFARDRGKPMLIVHLEPTELPGGLSLTIGRQQALLKHDRAELDYWQKLIMALREDAGESPLQSAGMPDQALGPGRHRWVLPLLAVLSMAVGLGWFLLGSPAPVSPPASSSVVAVASRPHLAVLPFTQVGNDSELAFMGDGIADDMRRQLVAAPGLSVAARMSSAEFSSAALDMDDIRSRLGVSHIVSGSAQLEGERLRINVELIDAGTERLLWSNTFERDANDLFILERQITAQILQVLGLDPVAAITQPDIDPAAYSAYQVGRHISFTDPAGALEQFERAVEIQPDFADAHAFIGWSHLDQANVGQARTLTAYPKAQASISRALAIDPLNVNALLANAMLNAVLNHDHQQLLDVCAELMQRDPTNERLLLVYSMILELAERFEDLMLLAKYWMKIDPLNANARVRLINSMMAAPEPSLERIRQEIAMLESISRQSYDSMRLSLALMEGSVGLAEELLREIAEVSTPIGRRWNLLLADYLADDMVSAREHAQALIDLPMTPAPVLAGAWLTLGNLPEAVAVVERALDEGEIQILYFLRGNARANTAESPAQPLFGAQDLEPLLRKARLDAASLARLKNQPVNF